jgi:RimJ/RimL family protein N-acetyltransferase
LSAALARRPGEGRPSGSWSTLQVDQDQLEVRLRASPVALRPVEDTDLDELFDQKRAPQAVWMAAFTAKDPNGRAAFDAHMARVRSAPDITLRAVTFDGQLAGSIASFVVEGATEITYWINRGGLGRDIASRAVALFLDLMPVRPLHARAASDNAGSLRVLRKSGLGSSVPRRPSPGSQRRHRGDHPSSG